MVEIDSAPRLNAVSRDKKSASVRRPLILVHDAKQKLREKNGRARNPSYGDFSLAVFIFKVTFDGLSEGGRLVLCRCFSC